MKKKYSRRRRYRPKKFLGRKFKRAVKSVLYKQAETKSFIAGASLYPIDTDFGCQNLNTGIVQTTSSEGRVGEKIFIRNIRIRGAVTMTNIATNSNGKSYRIMVVRTKTLLGPSATNQTMTLSNVFRVSPTGGANITQMHVDLHKVDVLYDKVGTIIPNFDHQGKIKPIFINIKINKNEFFEADNSGFFKTKNYWLLFGAWDGSASATPLNFSYTWAVNYKDF